MPLHDVSRPEPQPLYPGYQFDYAQITTDATISGTSGSPTAVIDGNAVTYDGNTKVKIEVYASVLSSGSAACVVEIYRDSTSLGRVIQVAPSFSGTEMGVVFDTPASGSHTYHAKAWINGGSNATWSAASGTFAPGVLRVTKS